MASDAAPIITAVAAALQTIIVAVASVYGLFQLAEARRSRRVSAVMPVFARLHSREAAERRRRLYQEIGPATGALTHDQEMVLQEVISEFYFVGYLVDKKLLEFRLVADLYYGTVVRCWTICEKYVMRDRARRGTQYASYFESFYWLCLEYGRLYRPADKITTFTGETPSTPEAAP